MHKLCNSLYARILANKHSWKYSPFAQPLLLLKQVGNIGYNVKKNKSMWSLAQPVETVLWHGRVTPVHSHSLRSYLCQKPQGNSTSPGRRRAATAQTSGSAAPKSRRPSLALPLCWHWYLLFDISEHWLPFPVLEECDSPWWFALDWHGPSTPSAVCVVHYSTAVVAGLHRNAKHSSETGWGWGVHLHLGISECLICWVAWLN